MPYDPINLGAAPDDNTGDPLRDGATKINAMFQEIFEELPQKATALALTEEATARSNAIAEVNENLALKANATDVGGKANLTQVIRRDIVLEGDALVSGVERLNHARNAGTLVTLAFQLLGNANTLFTDAFPLPPLPAPFLLASAELVVHASGGGGLDARLKSATTVYADWTDFPFPLDFDTEPAVAPGTLTLPLLPAAENISLNTDRFTPAYLATDSYGLTLWLRGVWMA